MERIALVLGATGGVGGEVARRLEGRGWSVRALHRDPDRVARAGGWTWIRGDSLDAAAVAGAALGASLIVHAVNPRGYRDWGRVVLPMLDATIAAARANGAQVLLPGTVYNYGPDAFPCVDEASPQNPRTFKGRIRAEMERRLAAATSSGEMQALIVRAGDFFGPHAGNNWFSQGLVKPGTCPRAISYPGKRGVGHQWAYLPDVGETMVRLVERGGRERFETFHMEGHWDEDGCHMVDAIVRALGEPTVSVRRMPWLAMRLAAPFVPLMRELVEMKYLWDLPVRMGNGKLVAALGEEPRTPLNKAVQTTLAAMGCLQPAARAGVPVPLLSAGRAA